MCLNMTQYVSIMPEYGLMSLNKPKKKNCLFPSERPGEIFVPTMRPVNFFWNKWIKKILNSKRKLEKKKKEKKNIEN